MDGLGSLIEFFADGVALLRTSDGSSVVALFISSMMGLSGVSKIRRPLNTRLAIENYLGIRSIPFEHAGVLLGTFELALAIGMLFRPSWTASPVSGLLFLFAIFTAWHLAKGHTFTCGCFGRDDETISMATLLRAVIAGGAAATLIAASPETIPIFNVDAVLLTLGSIGTVLLLQLIPSLLRWNTDPYHIGPNTLQEEARG